MNAKNRAEDCRYFVSDYNTQIMKNLALTLLVLCQMSISQHLFARGQYSNEVLTVVDVDVIGLENSHGLTMKS